MTFLGKLFVMGNVAVSLMLMAAGVGLYSTRTDWTDSPAKGGAPPGEIYLRKAALKEVQEGITPAEVTWSGSYAELFRREQVRYADRRFYSDTLHHVREKAGPAPSTPARTAQLDKGGLAVTDANGRPLLDDARDRAGGPLYSLAYYAGELSRKRDENLAELKHFKEEVEKDIALTEELTGKDGKRGLRDLIQDEKVKREGLELEASQTRPLFVNTKVEDAIAQRRLDLLDEQIRALKAQVEKLEKLDGGP
jgi:hypothetical protein